MASIRELTRRATKLHAALQQQRRGGGAGGVFVTLPGETPEALLARAAAEGRTGGLWSCRAPWMPTPGSARPSPSSET